jgi:20S proteasome alpha/beta subunit
LLAGYDEDGPGLYRIDYLGTMHKIHVAAHGYTGKMISGLLDNLYR